MSDRDIIDKIKNNLDIVTLVNRTCKLTKCGKLYKGAIESDSKSGKSLNVDKLQQVFYDFPTGEGGDIFNWIAFRDKLDIEADFPTILKIAADEAGIEIEEGMCGYSQRKHEISTFLTALAEHYHQSITEDIKDFIYNNWGIEYKTIEQMRIGLAPENDTILDTFGDLFDSDIIYSSGMVIKTRDGWKDLFKGRIMFPYWKNGKVVFNIGRKTDITPNVEWEESKYKKQLTNSKSHPYVSNHVVNKYFYGEDSIRYKDDYIVISEGVTDCITAIQKGIPSISPVTTNISEIQKERLIDIAKRKQRIFVCNDTEKNKSGIKGAMRTAEYLQENGFYVQIIELPTD